jgi:hypothetical protein
MSWCSGATCKKSEISVKILPQGVDSHLEGNYCEIEKHEEGAICSDSAVLNVQGDTGCKNS